MKSRARDIRSIMAVIYAWICGSRNSGGDPTVGSQFSSPRRRRPSQDHVEVSPWNPRSQRSYRPIRRSWWLSLGTMPELSAFVQDRPLLAFISGVLRSASMWMGVSNPLLGLGVLAACGIDSPLTLAYVLWSLVVSMFWSWLLGVPRGLICNGLYPFQGLLLAFYVCKSSAGVEDLPTNLGFLVLLLLINLIMYRALVSFFVNTLKTSPMLLTSLIVGFVYLAIKQTSSRMSPVPAPSPSPPLGNSTTLVDTLYLIALGMSNMVFSSNIYASLPLTLGMVLSSPILALMSWVGSAVAVLTVLMVAPLDLTHTSIQLYLFQGVINMGAVAGIFFVLNRESFLLGVVTTVASTLISISLHLVAGPVTCVGALGCYLVLIPLHMVGGTIPRVIPVDLVSMTTPEEHCRRYRLSKHVLSQLKGERVWLLKQRSEVFGKIEEALLPPLMCALAAQNDIERLRRVLEFGAAPDTPDYGGRSPLHVAASEGNKEAVYLLLRYRADLNRQDNACHTALTAALLGRHFDLALYLHRKGGRVLLPVHTLASTLCEMAAIGDTTALRMWTDCGVSPGSFADYGGSTPLDCAVNEATRSVLRRKAGGEFKLVLENSTALALDRPLPRVVRVRAWPIPAVDGVVLGEVLGREQPTLLAGPFVCLLMVLGEGELLRETIRLHAPSLHSMKDYDGRTPLHMACITGNLPAVKLLLWNKVQINAVDRFGCTPLLEACRYKQDKIARYLVRRGACLPPSTCTELHWAVWEREYEMVTRLVESGADTTWKDYAGRSCIDIAGPNSNMAEHIEALKREAAAPHTSAPAASKTSAPAASTTPIPAVTLSTIPSQTSPTDTHPTQPTIQHTTFSPSVTKEQ